MDIRTLSAGKREILFRFLSEGKEKTQDRIRTCQILLNDLAIEDDLRESLEQLRSNAEDDFGTFLHLMTVLKVPEKAELDSVVQSLGRVNLGSSPQENSPTKLKASRAPSLSEAIKEENGEEEDDEDEDEGLILKPSGLGDANSRVKRSLDDDSADEDKVVKLNPEEEANRIDRMLEAVSNLQEDLNRSTDDADTEVEQLGEEEEGEIQDIVPPLGADSNAPMSTTTGRFTSTAIRAAPAAKQGIANMARSLPVNAPVNPMRQAGSADPISGDDPLMKRTRNGQSDEPCMEIGNSIQTLAKSLHVGILGELPSPKNLFSAYAD